MTLEEMREKKREYGFTNEQISDYTGVPLATVQKIFAGVTESPRYATLQALETLFRQLEGERNPGLAADRVAESPAYMADYLKSQGEYTLADYYSLPDERRVELIDGVIYDMSSPESIHQILITAIWKDLFNFISDKKGDCLPMIAPLCSLTGMTGQWCSRTCWWYATAARWCGGVFTGRRTLWRRSFPNLHGKRTCM